MHDYCIFVHMTVQDLINDVQKAIVKLGSEEVSSRVGLAVCSNVEANIKRRVFNDGLATDGGKIGDYSTTPIYVNNDGYTGLPNRFKPVGKNSSGNFKNGNPRKSKYYSGGYKAFRNDVGRQTSYVDLELTSAMRLAFVTGRTSRGFAVGFINTEQSKKAVGNEKRFGKVIFSPNRDEVNEGIAAGYKELRLLLEG